MRQFMMVSTWLLWCAVPWAIAYARDGWTKFAIVATLSGAWSLVMTVTVSAIFKERK